MKHCFSILLLMVYMAAAIGTPIYTHYCGGQLLSKDVTPVSCCCDTSDDHNCCHDTVEYIQIDNSDYLAGELNAFEFKITDWIEIQVIAEDERIVQSVLPVASTEPPPPEPIPIWLSLQQLTYYG